MPLENIVALTISILSIAISSAAVWLTLFRRGRLAMTRPNLVFFGFDTVPKPTAKIFFRTLLHSTAVRGQVVEGMFIKLQHAGGGQVFGFWGYGEMNQMLPGSGLYVGQAGVAANHHFVQSVHQATYEFGSGDYKIEVFARLIGRNIPFRLMEFTVSVSDEHANVLARRGGVLFELEPDGGRYIGHAQNRGDAALPTGAGAVPSDLMQPTA